MSEGSGKDTLDGYIVLDSANAPQLEACQSGGAASKEPIDDTRDSTFTHQVPQPKIQESEVSKNGANKMNGTPALNEHLLKEDDRVMKPSGKDSGVSNINPFGYAFGQPYYPPSSSPPGVIIPHHIQDPTAFPINPFAPSYGPHDSPWHHSRHPQHHPPPPVEPELEKEEAFGGRYQVRTLYQQLAACKCCHIWTHTLPPAVSKEGVQRKTAPGTTRKLDDTFAIVDRRDVQGTQLRPLSIDINSPRLKELLTTVFEEYPDVDLMHPELKFHPPFVPFVHRWGNLQDLKQKTEIEDDRRLLQLLIDVLSDQISPALSTLDEYRKTGFIDFHNLQYAFTPGEIIIRRHKDQYSAGRLQSMRPRGGDYTLNVAVVDWNGQMCGYQMTPWKIEEFDHSKLLREMDIFPMTALSDSDQERIRSGLVERGKVFESLRGTHHRHFRGVLKDHNGPRYGLGSGVSSGQISSSADGRVMIDAFAYHIFQGVAPPVLKPLTEKELEDSTLSAPTWHPHLHPHPDSTSHPPPPPPPPVLCPPPLGPNDQFYTSTGLGSNPMHTRGALMDMQKQNELDLEPLTDDQRMLTVPYIKGYSLVKKRWADLDVNNIRPITWRSDAFENLVLDKEEKELMLALIDMKVDSPISGSGSGSNSVFDDFIDGKGQGITLLLSGPPGVGKTLTAESVSEHLKLPLYRMGASDLGQTAGSVTAALQTVLDLCATWNAVLLLDEADVFLEQRSNDQLQRNGLVSVFLTLLEYYRGVLILTTNRPTNIDAAFESRIDIMLKYQTLGEDAREQVWKNFLQTLPKDMVDVSADDVKELATREVNGRQIKSAVKTARILAVREGKPLGMKHLNAVLEIRKRGSNVCASVQEV